MKPKKVYPNQLCPCGSGRKSKKCCYAKKYSTYKYLMEKNESNKSK